MNKLTLKTALKITILIIGLSLIWNFGVAGVVAYKEGVFYANDVEGKLPSHSREALSKYDSYKKKRNNYIQIISEIDSQIENPSQIRENYGDVENLIKLRNLYREELSSLKSPISISPYYMNRPLYITFIAYVSLGILTFLLMPTSLKGLNVRKVLTVGLLLYIGWMSTGWLRNFVFYDEGRTVFSFVNYDIGPVSFFLQELRLLGACILISAVWWGWIVYFDDVLKRLQDRDSEPTSLFELSEHAYIITRMFTRWQITSIVIVAAFLPWTYHYWMLIVRQGDSRYVIHALVMHGYWAVTWILTTVPLFYVYRKWSALKTAVLSKAVSSDTNGEPDRTINIIKEISPLSNLQFAGASIVSVISFLLPLKDFFI